MLFKPCPTTMLTGYMFIKILIHITLVVKGILIKKRNNKKMAI